MIISGFDLKGVVRDGNQAIYCTGHDSSLFYQGSSNFACFVVSIRVMKTGITLLSPVIWMAETVKQAAVREAKEEAGVHLTEEEH